MFWPNLKFLQIPLFFIASFLFTINVEAQDVPVYRYYNPSADVHLWTASPQHEILTGYHLEGIAFYAPATGIPVKRYVNPKVRHLFYTVRPEHENLEGYRLNDIAFYSRPGGDPVYRYYNPSTNKHFWTAYPEHELLGTYRKEGIAFYASKTGTPLAVSLNGPQTFNPSAPETGVFFSINKNCNRISGKSWRCCGDVIVRYDGTMSALISTSSNRWQGFTGAMLIKFYDAQRNVIYQVVTNKYGVNGESSRIEEWNHKIKRPEILEFVMYTSVEGIHTSSNRTTDFIMERGKEYLKQKFQEGK